MTRLAKSIETLGNEVHARSPLTTLYFYDDTPRRDSDHDPNLHGVVCAIDIMAGHGLDLGGLAQEIVDARHPELAYVIYNRRIASRNTDWEWVDYDGANPHTDHIHASVGIGKDGYKEPPYDSTREWLNDMGDIFCKKGDKGLAVRSLQIGLNRIWKGHEDYNGKDIVLVTDLYDTSTCRAVYKLLNGPVAGDNFHPELYWRLLDHHADLYVTPGIQGPEGPEGPQGPAGDAAVLAYGDVLTVTRPA